MRRTHAAAEDLPGPTFESTVALIARLSAEHDVPPVGALGQRRHRRRAADTVVSRDAAERRGIGIRRLAPVAVGAAVMLVATLVLTTVRTAGPPALADQSTPVATSAPAPAAAPTQAPLPSTNPAAATTAPPKPVTPRPPAPGSTARRAPAAAGDGTQAAVVRGWRLATADEFNGTEPGAKWDAYDGPGNDGKGRRSPDAITVQNGIMTIRGDSKGTTGGLAWTDDQRFGKWEVRARFPKGDDQYHPVLLLWPWGKWPQGGEVDFAETTSASSDANFFLHYSSSNKQKSADKSLDLTQWHNYAVEWVDGRMTGYIDGQQWFRSTDAKTLPPGQMHLAIQLDYFPDGDSPKPTQMDVDYVRLYQ